MDFRTSISNKQYGLCEVCKSPLGYTSQAAHRIADTKANRAKYGNFIIDHMLNIGMVCCLKCNDKLNIGFNNGKILDLLEKIVKYEKDKF